MGDTNLLPIAVVQKLEENRISQDSVIFYQNGHWVYRVGSVIPQNNLLHNQAFDSLGPFDIHPVDISFILFPATSQYIIVQIGSRHLRDEEQARGIYAPIAEITLEGFARSVANIPDDATHFCWLYPPNNISNHDNLRLDNLHEENLLKIGGFAYFKVDRTNGDTFQLIHVNSLIVSADNGLTFVGPYPWRREFTEQLLSQNRIQPVTLSTIREKGAQYFAFINPYECFFNETYQTPWTPSAHGAFVYLFNSDHSPHPSDCYFSVSDNCLGVAPSDEGS